MIDFNQRMKELEKEERRTQTDIDADNLLFNNRKRKRIITYTIAIIVVALIFSGRVLMSSQNATNWFPGSTFLNRIKHLVPSASKQLKGEENDRINILLLGMGGEGHDGAYLTDTIILLSLKPSTKQVSLVSIPRDLTAPASGWRKINNVNAFAEAKNPGTGGTVTATAISDLLQIPIDYYIRVDFNGFTKIINELGGVEVNVENTFDDYTYPAAGQEDNPNYYARFEHLHIDKGPQTMDGTLALKYARSRHALGLEGSDFARARRQQLLLEAVKAKLLSRQTLLNPVMVSKLVNEFTNNVSTNLSVWEMLRLWDLAKDIDRNQIINKVLSDAPDGFLVSATGEDGAYILVPRSGNFSSIRNMVQNIFNDASGIVTTPKPIETISDNASVVINNGTWITGLASKTSITLGESKFKVLRTGNAVERTYTESIIYDLSYGRKNNSLEILKKITGATQAFDSPDWLKDYKSGDLNQPDFLLILGTDADKTN
ncbi:MAG: LCP family protein [Patescibacteria group bacterium]